MQERPNTAPCASRETRHTVTVETAARAHSCPVYVADVGKQPVPANTWPDREWREVKATRVDDTHWRAALSRDKDGTLPLYFVRVTDARGAALAALPPAPAQPAVANARDRGR